MIQKIKSFMKFFTLLALLSISFQLLATNIQLTIPAQVNGNIDSIASIASIVRTTSVNDTIPLSWHNGSYTGMRNISGNDLCNITVQAALLSGEQVVDSIKFYITIGNDTSIVTASTNSNLYGTIFTLYLVPETNIVHTDLFSKAIDTNIVKRVHIENLDSIADAYYAEGLYWYRNMPVNYQLFDSNYIPLILYPSGYHRNTVTTSQTVFAFYEQYQITHDSIDKVGFVNNANWLKNNNHSGYYLYDFDFSHTGLITLNEPWVSAMAQGEALGALTQAFYFLHDSVYLIEADSVFNTLCGNSAEFWSVYTDEKNYYWMEEYPNKDLCHVLNGKMAAIWGIFQYYTITRNKLAKCLLEAGLRTVRDHYNLWNVVNQDNSYYCKHNQIKPDYHAVHKNQYKTFAQRFNLPQLYDAYLCLNNTPNEILTDTIFALYSGDSIAVPVKSVLNWEVIENLDWLSAVRINDEIIVKIDSNLSDTSKTENISVLFENDETKRITILQLPKYYFSFSSDILISESNEDSLKCHFFTNIPNTHFEIEDPSWINTIINTDTLVIIIQNNYDTITRSTDIIASYKNIAFDTIRITQNAFIPYLDVTPNTVILKEYNDSAIVNLHTNIPTFDMNTNDDWYTYSLESDSTILIVSVYNDLSPKNGTLNISSSYLNTAINISHLATSGYKPVINSISEVYPIPTKGILHINPANNLTNYKLKIYNNMGSLVYSKTLYLQSTIDISQLPPNVYYINIIYEDTQEIHKIVKY